MSFQLTRLLTLFSPFAVLPFVHYLTYMLARTLPEPSSILSGIFGGLEGPLNPFSQQFKVRSYYDIIIDLASGSFGQTLDNQAISQVVTNSIFISSNSILLSLLIVVLSSLIAIFFTGRNGAELPKLFFGYISFLPVFLPVFLIFSIFLKWHPNVVGASAFSVLAAAISLSLIPSSLIALQSHLVTLKILDEPFANTIRAIGASEVRCKLFLFKNIALEIVPTLEKVVTSLVGAILLVEPILGINGMGTSAIRAMQRNDVELTLAYVLVFGLFVAFMRTVSKSIVFYLNKEARDF